MPRRQGAGVRAHHALPAAMRGRPAAGGTGGAAASGATRGVRRTPGRKLMPAWPRPRDRRRARSITIRISGRRRQRRRRKVVVVSLGDVDRHREPDEGAREAREAVRVGIRLSAIARRQEELGGAGDPIRVRGPCREAEHGHIAAGASLRSKILDEAERSQEEIRGGTVPRMIRMPRISMRTRMRTVTGSPPAMGLQGVNRRRKRGECRLVAATRAREARDRKRMRKSPGWWG